MRAFTLVALAAAVAAPTVAAQQSDVEVTEAVLARDVVERAPVDTASAFPADVGRVYLWTRISGAAGTTVHHVWFHGDEERGDVSLSVGGSPWRTWSSKTIPPEWTGAWRVEVRDADGNVVSEVRFTVGT